MRMQTDNPIIAARQKLKLNQSELARHLGIAQSTVSRWEKGKLKVGPLAKRAVEKLIEERQGASA